MRVRVTYTVNVTDDYRRAIRAYYGRDGLATRAEVQQWLWSYGNSMDDDLAEPWAEEEEEEEVLDR
jgi:hypothetical protein